MEQTGQLQILVATSETSNEPISLFLLIAKVVHDFEIKCFENKVEFFNFAFCSSILPT